MKQNLFYMSFVSLCILCLLLSTPVLANNTAAQPVKVNLDGYPLHFPVEPRIITGPDGVGGHTVVPFRLLAESIGVEVIWHQDTRSIHASGYEKEVVLTVDQLTAIVNDEVYELEVAPFIDQNHTLIPLRFFLEVFGAEVKWHGEQRLIDVISPARDLYTMAFYGLGSFHNRHYIPAFDGVTYTWSRINPNGEFVLNGADFYWPEDHPDATTEDLIQSGTQTGGEAFLMVAAFEENGEISALVHDQGKISLAIERMLELVIDRKMQGILLDFEGLRAREEYALTTQAYTLFVEQLVQALKPHDLQLGIALPPVNNSFNGYEYERLGELADFVLLMAYDYNPREQELFQLPEPMELVNQGIQETLKRISAEKLILGINLHYETPESTLDKIGLAKRYHLRGIGLWIMRLYNDDRIELINQSVPLN